MIMKTDTNKTVKQKHFIPRPDQFRIVGHVGADLERFKMLGNWENVAGTPVWR